VITRWQEIDDSLGEVVGREMSAISCCIIAMSAHRRAQSLGRHLMSADRRHVGRSLEPNALHDLPLNVEQTNLPLPAMSTPDDYFFPAGKRIIAVWFKSCRPDTHTRTHRRLTALPGPLQ